MRKKRLIAGLLSFVGGLTMGGLLVSQPVASKADGALEVSTAYRLTLTDYEVENYTTKVTAIDPNGEAVVLNRGILPLMTSGRYTIDYGNGRVQYVMSLLRGSVEGLTLSESLEESYTAGEVAALPVPVLEKKEGYSGECFYRVDVYQDGVRKESIVREEGETASYFFVNSGEYEIRYLSIDGFGLEEEWESFSVSVEKKEEVFFDSLPERANYGEILNIGFPYGFFEGISYGATVSVTDPDGQTTEWLAPEYQVLKKGTYSFSYRSEVNGKTVERSQTVTVEDQDRAFTFLNGTGKVEYGCVLPTNVDKYYGAHTSAALAADKTAVKITSLDATPKILFNKTIDLSQLSPEDNLISFFPISTDASGIMGVRVSLTDVYDPSKVVTVYVRKNPNDVGHSTGLVEFNSASASLANDPKEGVYGTLRTDANSAFIFYNSSLEAHRYADMRMYALRFDYEQNAVYAFGRNQNYEFTRQLMLDLDDSSKISYDNLFDGFTTGEVMLTIELDRNDNAGIYVAEIAGEKLGDEKELSKIVINVDTPQSEIYDGAVDYRYELPKASVSSCFKTNERISVRLEKDGEDCSELLENGGFTPKEAGRYEVKYLVAYRGSELCNSLIVNVNETPNPIAVDVPEGETVEYGSIYYVARPAWKGGNGALDYTYTVTLNGKEIRPTETGGFEIVESGALQIAVTVFDKIGSKMEYTYDVAVQDGIVLSMESAVPSSVRVGQEIAFPAFTATRVDGGTVTAVEKTRILVNGTTELTTDLYYTVPELSTLKVEYQTDIGNGFETQATYEIPVSSASVETTSELFVYDSQITTRLLENNLLFTMQPREEAYEIGVPNVLSTYNLNLSFVVNTGTFHADGVTVIFADVNGRDALKIRFHEIDAAKKQAKFTLNDGEEIFVLSGEQNNYTENCGAAAEIGEYAGRQYVAFSLELYEAGKYFRNGATREVVARFDKFENGGVFDGFTYNVCNMQIKVDGVNAYTEFGVSSISNQQFNYLLESLDYNLMDNVGPQINVYGNRSSTQVKIGESYTVATAKGFDVIQGSANVRVSVRTEKGDKLVNNLSAAQARTVTLNEVGYYTVEYTSTDGTGNKSTVSYKVIVADSTPPTLTVNGEYAKSYRLGASLKILGVTASDDGGESAVNVYLRTPDGLRLVELGETVKLAVKGDYQIVYRCEDGWKNTTRVVYEFTVS